MKKIYRVSYADLPLEHYEFEFEAKEFARKLKMIVNAPANIKIEEISLGNGKHENEPLTRNRGYGK